MSNRRLPRRVRVAILVCSVGIVGHTIMTVLHVAPINPISLDLAPAISAYTLPFFQQNWQLFAPEPINQEHGMLVRALQEDHHGKPLTTEYYDFTSPIIESIHSTRLFPPRRTRLVTSIQQLLAFVDPLAERFREIQFQQEDGEEPRDTTPIDQTLTPQEEETRQLAADMLLRIAGDAAEDQWGESITHIQIRFVTNRFPPFSERSNPSRIGEINISDSDWIPIETYRQE